jgi:hypothetical protein
VRENDIFNLLAKAECVHRGFGSIKQNEPLSIKIFSHLAALGLPYGRNERTFFHKI